MMIYYDFFETGTAVGRLRLRANELGLMGVDHPNQHDLVAAGDEQNSNQEFICQAKQELSEYFLRKRFVFEVALNPQGTVFQRQVWEALRGIPYGETRSYSDIAISINNPKGVRAVGLANGRNPLSIFVPCHRVIGKNKKLTGYAGGLTTKSCLLGLEQGVLL